MKNKRFRKRTIEEKKRISEGTIKGIATARERGKILGQPAKARDLIQQSKHMITMLKASGVPSNEIAEKLNVSMGALSQNGWKTF